MISQETGRGFDLQDSLLCLVHVEGAQILRQSKTRRPYYIQEDQQDYKFPQQPSDHVYGLKGWVNPHR